MKFEIVSVDKAEGAILGHNVAGDGGRRLFRKGRSLTAEDVERLRSIGRRSVHVARLEPGDVGEDEAAARIAEAIGGDGLRLSRATTGRVNLSAETLGLLRVDLDRLDAVNDHQGVTLATLPGHAVVALGKTAATLKILPYALPGAVVAAAVAVGRVLRVDPLPERRVGLVLTGSATARERVEPSFRGALGQRLSALGSRLERVDYVVDADGAEERLAEALVEQRRAGLDLLILAGETAIQDRHDLAPRAVERAGGEVTCFGAPVDPGNLLLLAWLGEVPVLGAPGCSRSPKTNIVDLVLPRLLVGDRLDRRDVRAFGHGGLLEDVPERPLPRSRIE